MTVTNLRIELSENGIPWISTKYYDRENLEAKLLVVKYSKNVPKVCTAHISNFEMIEPDVFNNLTVNGLVYELNRRGINA